MAGRRSKEQPADEVDWLATEHWIRNESDKLAIENGCWFDPEMAAWAVWWQETHCPLYRGEYAGTNIRYFSTAEDPKWEVPDDFDEALPLYLERMRRHNRLHHEGAFMHWQGEMMFQLYGWARFHHRKKDENGNKLIVRRYREAIVFAAKKQGKTPLLSANGLYLTIGDGEEGAKVAFLAKDGKQARKMVGDHALKMVELSPSLSEECRSQADECIIKHDETNSEMFAIAAGNASAADSQHGFDLNGLMMDELHVVRRVTVNKFGRSMRARTQPVMIKASTAGDNPDSYGKEQFDHAIKIRDGETKIDNTYVAIYAAPQNATDEDIAANIEQYIRMANPSLGHLVDMKDTLDDYHAVKGSPYDFAVFKYEILNIWQHAAVTWITQPVWAACGGWAFDREEAEDRPCVLGYDHAKSKDLSAAVLAWPNDNESVNIKAFFWCNERRIRQLAAFQPEILEWADEGLIKVTDGDTHDTGRIKRDLRDIILKYGVIGMVHDPFYCDEIVNFLRDGEMDRDDRWIYEPVLTSDQIVRMNQQKSTQTGPTTFFEEDVINKKLRHESNLVLDWQFSHATIGQDQRGNIVIQKENRESFRTVDGCQASVMARFGILDYPDFQTQVLDFYETYEDGMEF
jgi:phage terminase large subunit-like protein